MSRVSPAEFDLNFKLLSSADHQAAAVVAPVGQCQKTTIHQTRDLMMPKETSRLNAKFNQIKLPSSFI